jgi:hypothetical protein
LKGALNNASFRDTCKLAELIGGTKRQGKGDHQMYSHDLYQEGNLNFQSVKGKAKPYQVRQLLDLIDDNNLLDEEGEE